jgi:hypothetical protein
MPTKEDVAIDTLNVRLALIHHLLKLQEVILGQTEEKAEYTDLVTHLSEPQLCNDHYLARDMLRGSTTDPGKIVEICALGEKILFGLRYLKLVPPTT